MDFDKLYDMFCEYYKDDGSNDEIMRGRIEKAFLKYAQALVKNCSIPYVVGRSEQLACVHPYGEVYQSETECYCEKCGKDLTEAS